jgi:hypothetical protein
VGSVGLWSMHVGHGTSTLLGQQTGPQMWCAALHCFLEEKFLFWLEVLSVVGAVGDAAHALTATIEWLNEVCPY